MSPSEMYVVQKSRSFGGVKNEGGAGTDHAHHQPERGGGYYGRWTPKFGAEPGRRTPIFGSDHGRRTPNLGSLRKKFALTKKTVSLDEVPTDGLSWKKRNKVKVGNFFRWFKKERPDDYEEQQGIYERLKGAMGRQEGGLAPLAEGIHEYGKKMNHRSVSLESVWSTGSATSSFAFVPVNHYKVGRYIEPKKKIAISINCSQTTYRARLEETEKRKEADKDLTLKTKYRLPGSESPPPTRKSEDPDYLPFGPILPSKSSPSVPSELFRHLKSIDSDSETDTTVHESVSQRESPSLSRSRVTDRSTSPLRNRDANTGCDDRELTTHTTATTTTVIPPDQTAQGQKIKPRVYSGQFLHTTTLRFEEDSAGRSVAEDDREAESAVGFARVVENGQELALSAERDRDLRSGPRKTEFVPKTSADLRHQYQARNPFGDTVSLAPTLPADDHQRSSVISDEFSPFYHVPGKRRAPNPPVNGERNDSPGNLSSGSTSSGRNVLHSRKKGPAPPPPPSSQSTPAPPPATGDLNMTGKLADSQTERSQGSLQCHQQPVPMDSCPNDSWVLQEGVLQPLRGSRQDLSATEDKEAKEVKVPISPKPWYKRSIRDTNEKKPKEKKDKKAKSPENLPEIHLGRESIKVQENFDEKYSYFTRMSRENIHEIPKSPKQFLRSKILTNSPKPERPNSRPISGLVGISDLDRQAAEIIRKKNEDEAAKKKEEDEKFYKAEREPQEVIDTIMENVSRRMMDFDRKVSKDNSASKLFKKANDDNTPKDPLYIKESDTDSGERMEAPVKKDVTKELDPVDRNVVNMDTVVSDLNSFLASTRRAMNSPASQKKNSVGSQGKSGSQDRKGSTSGSHSINGSLNGSQGRNGARLGSPEKNVGLVRKGSFPGSKPVNSTALSGSASSSEDSTLSGNRPQLNSSGRYGAVSEPIRPNQSHPYPSGRDCSADGVQSRLGPDPDLAGKQDNPDAAHLNQTQIFMRKKNSCQEPSKVFTGPAISQSTARMNNSPSTTSSAGFKGSSSTHRNSLTFSTIPEVSENSSSQSTPYEGPPFFNDQESANRRRPLRNSFNFEDFPKSSLPDPPNAAPLPPLAVEKADGWTCGRCTLINYNAQIWCEACGGKRTNAPATDANNQAREPAMKDSDLDNEAEEEAPRVGHVLDKLVLFSAMEAKAMETPSLQRRKSGDFNKITRNYSFSGRTATPPMNSIEENPLIKTLERITQTQAQLVKPSEVFTTSGPRIKQSPENAGPSLVSNNSLQDQQGTKKQAHADIIKEQERLLNQAKQNLLNQKQNVEQMILAEEAKTMPRSTEDKQSEPRQDHSDFRSEKLEILESNEVQEKKKNVPKFEVKKDFGLTRTSSFNQSFDFTKTPRSFLVQRKVIETEKEKPVAPKLQILSAKVTRKFSAPDNDDARQSRLDYFQGSKNDDICSRSLPRKQSKILRTNSRESQLSSTVPDIVPQIPYKKASEPYYAKPVSPPRPVTPPRPQSPVRTSSSTTCSSSEDSPPPRPTSPRLQLPSYQDREERQECTKIQQVEKFSNLDSIQAKLNQNSDKCTQDVDKTDASTSQSALVRKKSDPRADDESRTGQTEAENIRPMTSASDLQFSKSKISTPNSVQTQSILPNSNTQYSQPNKVVASMSNISTSKTSSKPSSKSSSQYSQSELSASSTKYSPVTSFATPQFSQSESPASRPICSPSTSSTSNLGISTPAVVSNSLHIQPRIPVNNPSLYSQSNQRDSQFSRSLDSSSQYLSRAGANNSRYSPGARDSRPGSRSVTPTQSYSDLTPLHTPVLRRNSYLPDHLERSHSRLSDLDSDYPPFEMSREYNDLARIGSTSIISESNYSAITPDVSRKLCLSAKVEPKFSHDFGFVSSKKESVPKPPRRTRSKDVPSRPGSRLSSRPGSRLSCSSRESTPVNQIKKTVMQLESPLRPRRYRGKNYSGLDEQGRPGSYKQQSPDSYYEVLNPPPATFPANSRSAFSDSSSDSDFLTPQASPRMSRNSSRAQLQTHPAFEQRSRHHDYSYENFRDNPVMKDHRKVQRLSKNSVEYTVAQKPRQVPPRTSLDPIPTPRKTTLSRSRDGSHESEPHYKVPKPNPVPVERVNHLYAEPVYKQDKVRNARRKVLDKQTSEESDDSDESGIYAVIQPRRIDDPKRDRVTKSKTNQENKLNEKTKVKEDHGKEKISIDLQSRSNGKKGKNKAKNSGDKVNKNIYKETNKKHEDSKLTPPSKQSKNSQKGRNNAPKNLKAPGENQQKSNNISTSSTKDSFKSVGKASANKKESPRKGKNSPEKGKRKSDIGPKPNREFSNYTPVEMPMRPDWFDDMKPKDDCTDSRPKSIVDGVLYTSRGLLDSYEIMKKPISFNLIKPEVFELYDVCQNHPKLQKIEEKLPQTVDKKSDPVKVKQEDKHDIIKIEGQKTKDQGKDMLDGRLPDVSYIRQDSYENTKSEAKRDQPYKSSAENPFRQGPKAGIESERVRSLLVGVGKGQEQDLLVKLEEAIARGDHKYAASLAKELSKIKISSRLTEQEDKPADTVEQRKLSQGKEPDQKNSSQGKEERKTTERQTSKESKVSEKLQSRRNSQVIKTIKVEMYVEDAVSAQGPIPVDINPVITVADLKLQIEREFEIPATVQRWILGKHLVSQDTASVSSLGVDRDGQQIYLYLVSPEEQAQAAEEKPAAPLHNSPPNHRIPPPNEPFVKGRYWNYEEERWSFCNSDDDEERNEEVKQMNEVKEEEKVVEDQKKEGEEDEGEWEYYYEDVEEKKEGGEVEVAAAVEAPANLDGWECPVCTLHNPLDRPGCMACTTERPAQLGAAAVVAGAGDAAKENGAKATEKEKPTAAAAAKKDGGLDAYKQLENLDVIPNAEEFECVVCFLDIEPGDGVVLRECLHTFCKLCLAAAIEHSDSPKVKCPYKDDNYSCDMDMLDREIKALVSPAVYEKHQKKSVKEAEANIQGAFHCKTPDCAGWTVIEDNVNTFKCPLCKRTNCITCQAVHDGMDCKQYQQYTLNEATDENSKKTKEWIDGLIEKGEALYCPSCQVLLLKKWGCDWVRCTYCRTEICWVTKQLRWGPNGRGDTSGGCKCMADGRTKCHKLCNYCH